MTRRTLSTILLALLLPVGLWGMIQHPNLERGFSAETAFQIGDIDHVNLFNGGLTLTIPIGGEYPAGGSFSYALTLVYSSKLWDWEVECDEITPEPPEPPVCRQYPEPSPDFNAGFGWMVSLGRVYPPGTMPRNESSHWLYVGPDGAEHRFHEDLHVGDPVVPNVLYSRDNSYLRMKSFGATRVIEFPDGSKHTFDSDGYLSEMRDVYGNYLRVTRSGNLWTLNDRFRRHTIRFVNLEVDGMSQPMVQRIDLAAFGGSTATYRFDYQTVDVDRPCPFDPRVMSAFLPPVSEQVTVPMLRSVTLPDGSNYWMPPTASVPSNNGYYLSAPREESGCWRNGTIRKVTLPTQGSITWDYAPYTFPTGNSGGSTALAPHLTFLSRSPGVIRRTLQGVGSAGGGTWRYEPDGVNFNNVGPAENGVRAVEIIRHVINPQNDKTTHYFAGHIAVPPNPDALRWEYGLPFSPRRPRAGSSGNRLAYVSSVSFDGAGNNAQRTNWVRYGKDWARPNRELDANRRVAYERTDYEDGTWSDVRHLDYDGLGHYRRTLTGGNFGSGDVRDTYVNYNPGTNSTPSVNAPWILGLFDYMQQSEGPRLERQSYCFDASTGFLLRKRIHKNGAQKSAGDVVMAQTRNPRGHVIQERHHLARAGATGNLCSIGLGGFDYRIDHTYRNGSRMTSRYHTGSAPLPFFSLDQTIDANTGLPKSSRDVSGLNTDLIYDNLGRITDIRSSTGAWTRYTYSRATSTSNLAKIFVAHRRTGATSGTALAQSAYYFDAYGRVWQERELMPDGTWSKVETRYNAMGWKTRVSELQSANVSGGAQRFTDFLEFDPFGRPGRIRPPDGAQHDIVIDYNGVRGIHRTARVRTAGNAGAITLSNATTSETYDRQGRLWKVDEPSGGLHAVYAYDAGNRLIRASLNGGGVTQTRQFAYDGRGFLLAERHPEKGASNNGGWVSYNDHDARGHAREKVDGTVTLAMSYDSAERLTLVRIPGAGGRTLKTFQYAANNSGTNRRRGRLWKATRFNFAEAPWAPGNFGTIAVTEEYEYRGPDGRPSRRVTKVGPDSEFTQAWVHDDLGNVTQLNYPRCVNGGCLSSGAGPFRPQQFSYRNGRMTQVSGFVDFIGYHPNGMIAHVSHNNGTTYRTDVAPDGMRRPSNIHLSLPGIGQLSFGNHRYDGAGNLIVRGPEYFLYDRVSRITRFQRGDGTNQRYTYDTFGNMGSVTTFDGSSNETRTFAINRQKNRLAGTAYDARGNMLQWATQDYRYDVLNNLQHKDFPWETYIYTADDERVLTMRYRPGGVGTANLDEIYTLRDLDGKVLRRYFTRGGSKGTWTWSSDYLHDGRGWVLVEIQNRPFPLRNKHYAHDHLGTPVVITGQDGAIISTDSLWAYGEPVDPNQSFTVQRFTGHERDYSPDGRAFDLDYMHARYAVPYMGRFMSVDPASRSQNPKMPQSWNRYAYGLSNPMKYVDPDGRCAVPAGLEEGQVGICIEAFIAAPRIGGIGFGDGRSFAANDPSATARVSFKMRVDPGSGDVLDQSLEAGVSEVGISKDLSFGLQGKAELQGGSAKTEDGTNFSIFLTGKNGFSFLNALGTINVLANLSVGKDGAVSVDGSSRTKSFPSVEGFAYRIVQGELVVEVLFRNPEDNPGGLNGPMNVPLKE